MRFFKQRHGCVCVHVLVSLLLFGVLSATAATQRYINDQYAPVYAIKDTVIVTGDGRTLENVSILLKDGLIAAIGDSIAIPAEAEVIDGKDLRNYPGFIDMHTTLGFIPVPGSDRRTRPGSGGQQQAAQEKEEKKDRKYDANLRPDRVAIDRIDMNDPKIKEARETGITTALSMPARGVFPGKASVIATHGDDPLKASVLAEGNQVIQYANERGGYPGTLFAVVSFQKQTLLDAQYYLQREADADRNPRGSLNALRKRLTYDTVLRNLFGVVEGKEEVLILAARENDIKRAVDLAHFEDQFDLNYMLVGVAEGYRIVDLLKKENVPVVVSLNYPPPNRTTGYAFNLPIKPYKAPAPAESEPTEGTEKKSGEQQKSGSKKEAEEKFEIDERVKAEIQGNASALHNAGIKTALSAGGNYPDFLKNLRLAVEAGLPAETALEKISLTPAKWLGIDDITGTVEVGKLANIVVTDGDLFAEKTKIKHVFVDGKKYELKEPEVPAGGPAGRVAGTWDITLEAPGMGSQTSTMILKVSGSSITGSIDTEMGMLDIESGSLRGNKLTLNVSMMGRTVAFIGTVKGNKMSGSADLGMATLTFTARKPGWK